MNKKLYLVLVFTSLISFSCSNKEEKSSDSNVNHLSQSEKITPIEQLRTEASRLNGGGSIKTVELENGKAIITYVKNYKEYKDLNPQSRLTENDLKSYWSTGNAIKKMLNGSPARLMKNLDFINEVKIILPFENKVYEIDVRKSDLEKFIGKNISEIKENWVKEFADPYIYNEKKRDQFFDKFGHIN